MKTVAIIQARTGSSRLPGKVLADIAGRSMLERVVRRASRARNLHQVVVATTTESTDQPVVNLCQRMGVDAFRGSEGDVLDRTFRAARNHGAEVVVRITSDCPLIDPQVVDLVIDSLNTHPPKDSPPDYASNTMERTFPRGLDTEAMTFEALEHAWREAEEPYQRVHVTPYFYQNPDRFRLLSVTAEENFSAHRWTVDTAPDLELIRAIYGRFTDDTFNWREALELVEGEPELADINRQTNQKPLEEG